MHSGSGVSVSTFSHQLTTHPSAHDLCFAALACGCPCAQELVQGPWRAVAVPSDYVQHPPNDLHKSKRLLFRCVTVEVALTMKSLTPHMGLLCAAQACCAFLAMARRCRRGSVFACVALLRTPRQPAAGTGSALPVPATPRKAGATATTSSVAPCAREGACLGRRSTAPRTTTPRRTRHQLRGHPRGRSTYYWAASLVARRW